MHFDSQSNVAIWFLSAAHQQSTSIRWSAAMSWQRGSIRVFTLSSLTEILWRTVEQRATGDEMDCSSVRVRVRRAGRRSVDTLSQSLPLWRTSPPVSRCLSSPRTCYIVQWNECNSGAQWSGRSLHRTAPNTWNAPRRWALASRSVHTKSLFLMRHQSARGRPRAIRCHRGSVPPAIYHFVRSNTGEVCPSRSCGKHSLLVLSRCDGPLWNANSKPFDVIIFFWKREVQFTSGHGSIWSKYDILT